MAIKGSDILVKKGTALAGTAFAGGRTTSLSISSETVDVTSADNVNKWRELLPGAGIKSMSVTITGVFDNTATHNQAIADVIAATVDAYGIILGDAGFFEGDFQVTNVEPAGEYNGEMTYSISLESAGDITYTAGAPS